MKVWRFFDRVLTLVLCLWVVFRLVSWDESPSPISEAEIPATFEKTWKDLKAKNLVHGSILIYQDNQLIFSDGPKNDKSPIASLSKSFVGFRFFQLQRAGLSLDTPVCQWLPNFCGEGLDKMTLQHLLDHRSGFGRDLSVFHFLERFIHPGWSIKEIDTLELDKESLKSGPGEKFLYSNFGYLVLSRVLEIIEHKEFAEVISALTQEAGLKDTAVIKKGQVFPIYQLMPYTGFHWVMTTKNNLYRSAGGGGIQSTPEDVARWLHFLEKNNFEKVLTESKKNYSHGITQPKKASYKGFWHNGATFGTYTFMASVPASRLRIVIIENQMTYTKQWTQLTEKFEQYFY